MRQRMLFFLLLLQVTGADAAATKPVPGDPLKGTGTVKRSVLSYSELFFKPCPNNSSR